MPDALLNTAEDADKFENELIRKVQENQTELRNLEADLKKAKSKPVVNLQEVTSIQERINGNKYWTNHTSRELEVFRLRRASKPEKLYKVWLIPGSNVDRITDPLEK